MHSKTPKIDKIETALANKSKNYWSTMRTNMALLNRSDQVDELTIDTIREELADILDLGILNYPQTLLQAGIEPQQTLKDRKQRLGLRIDPLDHSPDEKRFLKDMAFKADNMRKSNWSWRIGQEAQEKHTLGWHPFFVTLTVDPTLTDPKELWQQGREFRKYIRRLVNVVCKELGHPPAHKKPYRPESDYVTYAGVIEHGKSREHHHGHFCIWMRAIPASWRNCPNSGIRNPANRTKNECLPMRTRWPWSLPGLSPALYFRSVGDIWEKVYGFILPLKDGKPMKVATPKAAGAYITKYLSKEHREWHHRMKATRNLGLAKIKLIIKMIDPIDVEALTWRPKKSTTNLSLMQIHSVPQGLLRSLAKQQSYLIKFRQNRLDLIELLQRNYPSFTRMLKSVKDGARPDRMDSHQFYDWVGKFLPEIRGYSDTRLIEAHKLLAQAFPPEKTRIKHVKIGANEIGYT